MIVLTSLVTFAAIMLLYHHHIRMHVASQRNKALILGIMLGTASSILMLYPVELTSDVTFSNRPMFVAFAGLLGGWVGAASALVVAAATRMAIAGPDMSVGILVLSAAAILGALGHIFLNRIQWRPIWSWVTIGGLVSLSVSFVWVLVLPDPARVPSIRNTVAMLAISSLIGAMAAGYLQSRVRDVVERRQLAMAQSHTDELTGIFNRRGLHMAYHSIAFSGQETGVALLTIDLDHFKLVNDRFGHNAGDDLLKLISGRINQLIRKGDIFARLGGDEFVVLLTNTTHEQAESIAKRFCRVINESPMVFETSGQLHDAHEMVTASIGVAFTPMLTKRFEDLLKASDDLLYTAKRNGRGRVVVAEVALLNG